MVVLWVLLGVVLLLVWMLGAHIELAVRLFGGYPDPWGIIFDGCFHYWREPEPHRRFCNRCGMEQKQVFSIDAWDWYVVRGKR